MHLDSAVAVFQVRNNDIVTHVTINNASDYRTNRLYQTRNPNQSPLARLAISPIIRYPTVICSLLVRRINTCKCNHGHSHSALCSSLCDHINDPEGSRQQHAGLSLEHLQYFDTIGRVTGKETAQETAL